MSDEAPAGPTATIPPDDPDRTATIANPEAERAEHISVVGDTYTILVSGSDTAGRYTLIDMHVPNGGGPPPHRHDFEEMFTVLEGEIEITFRGEKSTARAGDTVNVPANAPHQFTNAAAAPARLLCMCTPAGQEELFRQIGDPVPTRTSPAPELDPDTQSRAEEEGARTRAEVPDRTAAAFRCEPFGHSGSMLARKGSTRRG